jgi:capsular exopolysaccharide synthesis family protein
LARLKQINLFDFFDLESPYATEFRRLLHNINGTVADQASKTKTILVTSAMLAEGKSTVTAFLALTSARSRLRKTLLIDCDLRRPTLHLLFSIPRQNGITEILNENRKTKEAIKKTSEPNLDIITAGKAVAHPTDVLNSTAIRKMIDEVRFYYDLILIDCAPILPVSDPIILAAETDGVIMVVKAGSTQREVVKRASDLMRDNKSRLLGIVLNNLNNAMPYYFNDSYYGYDYKSRPED